MKWLLSLGGLSMMVATTVQASVIWRMGDHATAWETGNFAQVDHAAHDVTLLGRDRNGLMTSPLFSVQAEDYAYAEIYYRMTGVQNILALMFSSGEDQLFDGHVYTATLVPSERHEPGRILIPLRGHDKWQGLIRQLRLVLPSRNEGTELTILGIALRAERDWLDNGSLVALREDGTPWGWQVTAAPGAWTQQCDAMGWCLTATGPGTAEISARLPHIRQGQRYRLGVDGSGPAGYRVIARFFGKEGQVVAEKPLMPDEQGRYTLAYEATDAYVSGRLILQAESRTAGDQVILRHAFLENLGSVNAWRGEWIWPDPQPQAEQHAFFFHAFEIDDPSVFTGALLQVTCDDQFGLWLNGVQVASNNRWAEPRVVDVREHLRPGRNVFYARTFNRSGPAGFLAEMRLDRRDGETPSYVFTDATWQASLERIVDGEHPEYQPDPAQWQPAHSFGAPPVNPWSILTLHEALPVPPEVRPVDRQRIAAETLHARINTESNYPRIELNGQVVVPTLFGSRASGDRTQSLVSAAEGGFNLYRLWWEMGEAWRPDGTLDFSGLDQAIETHFRHNPQARVMLAFRVTAPSWWMARYPEELCVFSDGSTDGHAYGQLPSVVSERWLSDVQRCMTQLIAHVEASWYAARVIGYMPCSHSGPEWVIANKQFDLPDYSAPMQAYFRAFLKEKYRGDVAQLREAWGQPAVTFDTAAIPDRDRRGPRDRWLLDARQDADVIDYNRAHSRAVGDAILRLTGQIRQQAPNKLTMIYYGYTMTLAQLAFYPQATGHYDLERVLASGQVDLFASPISYMWRQPGDMSGIKALQRTFRRHNVVWLQEADSRSSLTEDAFAHKYNHHLQAAAMENRREFIYALANRLGIWFFDMTGGWYDHPVYTDDFRQMHALYAEALAEPITYQAPIGVFFDEQALDATSTQVGNFSSNHPRLLAYDFQRGLARSGQPYDLLAMGDLMTIEPGTYRVLVLVNAHRYDLAWVRQLHDRFDRTGTTLVFLGTPGLVGGGVAEASQMVGMTLQSAAPGTALRYTLTPAVGGPQVTGYAGVRPPEALQVVDRAVEVLGRYADGTVAAARKALPGGGTSVYLAAADNTGTFWRHLLQSSGVPPLVDARDRVVFDGRRLGLIAMDAPGVRQVQLPVTGGRVVEAFSGKLVAEDARQFEISLEPGQSVLLKIETDAVTR